MGADRVCFLSTFLLRASVREKKRKHCKLTISSNSDPDELEEYESRTIALANAGLASSGDKTQKWEWSGEWNRWVPSPSAAAAPVIQTTDHDQVALNSIAASGSEAARKFLEANRNIQPGFR